MSLKVWLPLDGDLHNQGLSDAVFSKATNVWGAGKIGAQSLLASTGTGSVMVNELKDKKEFSIAYWVKIDSSLTFSSWQDIWAVDYTNATGTYPIRDEHTSTAGNHQLLMAKETNVGSNTNGYIGMTIANAPDTWQHIVLVKGLTQTKSYVNGELKLTRNNTDFETSNGKLTGNVRIGATTCGAYLNDVRIYDHCLSAAEVKEIAQGLVLHYKLDNNGLGNKNLLWGTLVPSTIMYSVVSICGTKHASGQGSTYVSHVRSNRPHGIQCTVGTAARPYIALGHPTASTCLASPDPMWGLTAGQTYTFSGDLEYKVYSGNLELASYFVIRLYYIKSGETAWTNAGNLKTFTTHPGEVHNYHFELPFTIPENAIGWYILIASNNASASHNAAGDYVAIDNIKLEMGDIATPYAPAPEDFGTALIIEDSSGYNHNGTASDNLITSTNTPRYSASTHFNGSNTYIACGRGGMVRDAITVNIWGYQDTWSATPGNMVSCTQSGGWNFENNNSRITFACGTGESANTYKSVYWANHPFSSLTSGWHMFTGTYDGYTTRLYVDGDLVASSGTNTEHIPLFYNSSNGIFIGAEANTNQTTPTTPYFNGNLSDFRIYCTSLLDTDIKQLYNTNMKIDKQANIHPFETNEDKYNKITKTGILYNNIVEPYLTLPDGSHWKLLLYHYVDGGKNLFTQSNATYCNELGLYSRLKDINNYTYNDKYEFYVIQDGVEYRWTQTSQPTAASISGLTTVSGYTNPVNGLAKANQTYTYLGYNSWWGACGSWTQYSTGGKTGIPGFGAHNAAGMCTEYLALYARIDDFQASFINLNSEANQFIER